MAPSLLLTLDTTPAVSAAGGPYVCLCCMPFLYAAAECRSLFLICVDIKVQREDLVTSLSNSKGTLLIVMASGSVPSLSACGPLVFKSQYLSDET